MSVATFFVLHLADAKPEDLVLFHCTECEEDVQAGESDSHAHRKHRASTIRVFWTERGYTDWLKEQKLRQQIKEMDA